MSGKKRAFVAALLAGWLGGAIAAAVRREEGRAVYLVDDKPFFVYSATFVYYDYPKDLWPARLVRLKGMGFNTVQIPPRREDPPGEAGDRDLIDLLRLARRLGLRVWLDGETAAPELQAFWSSRGGPILEDLAGIHASWFPPVGSSPAIPRLLGPADLVSLQQLIKRQAARGRFPPLVSAFDAGWPAGEEGRLRPSDASNYLLATRLLLADGAKVLNCAAVLEGLSAGDREPALSLSDEPRSHAAVFSRNGALVTHFGRLLATLHPAERPPAGEPPLVAMLPGAQQKPNSQLRLGLLASRAPRSPVFISALNFSADRPVAGVLTVTDPRTHRRLRLRNLNLPPRQALLMPINLVLATPEVCPTCSAFAPDERIVSATAELTSVVFENGVLSMEFVAPGEGELVMELAREPHGPVLTAARIRSLDWDEKTRTLRVRIPAGRPPDFRSRVGLGVQEPDSSVFLKAPPRLVIGSTVLVTASFSSPEMAARSRLLVPSGWRVKAEPGRPDEMEYAVEVPADSVPGDAATISVEMEGRVAQSAALPLTPPVSVRVRPEDALHLRRDTGLPIRPHLASLSLPSRRMYQIYLRNYYDEIKTFEVSAAGDGLVFSPPRQEISIGPNLEREATLSAVPSIPRSDLYRWNLEVRDGARKIVTPLVLAVIAEGESLAYEMDLDRDGFPELVLENQKLRAVFSPRHNGRSDEFLLKDAGVNAFSGAAVLEAGSPLEGRVTGPGRIELRTAEMVRRISLGGKDSFFEVEQSGGPADWKVSTSLVDEPGKTRFTILAPDAQIETERRPFATHFRLHFPGDGPRRARFVLEPAAAGKPAASP
ncbi:MAG: beta-galactosidase [Acidobacteria bacterium]|nr:beta-galactosidase [Acidobacteriota bacterium]